MAEMGTRLPGERDGGCELNLPAPLAQFPSLCDGASSGEERVLQSVSVSVCGNRLHPYLCWNVCLAGDNKTFEVCVGTE